MLDGRTIVRVWPYRRVTDEWGEDGRQELDPVDVAATLKWQGAAESADLTVSPATAVKIIAREWPGSENSRFEHGGRVFEQVGPTREFTGSPVTAHVEVYGRLTAAEGGWNG